MKVRFANDRISACVLSLRVVRAGGCVLGGEAECVALEICSMCTKRANAVHFAGFAKLDPMHVSPSWYHGAVRIIRMHA